MRQGGTWKSLKCETAHSGRVTAHVCLNMLTYGFSAIKMFFVDNFSMAQGQLVSQQHSVFRTSSVESMYEI